MKKQELAQYLREGKCLDEIFFLKQGADCTIFKADEFSASDDILYIPDMELNKINYFSSVKDEKEIREILDECYTGNDFMDICNGSERIAKELFSCVDWQHPESALLEVEDEMQTMENW